MTISTFLRTHSLETVEVKSWKGARAFLVAQYLHTVPWAQLVIGLAMFLIIYILGAPAIGAVSISDIQVLRTMFSGMGAVSGIVNIILRVAEKAARIRDSNKT